MNKVDYLLSNQFSLMSLEEKLEVKRLGAYHPNDVKITQKDKRPNHNFCVPRFERTDWLTASVARNSLFCFPCLLFGGDTAWTQQGIVDLKHLSDKIRIHECNTSHIGNAVKLSMLGKVNIACQLNEGRISHFTPAGRVSGPRRPVLFFRQPISQSPVNTQVAKYTSKTSQNDLLDCMLEIYGQKLAVEISQASFVAVQADKTTDVACVNQCVILLRYITDAFMVVERFLTFSPLLDRTAAGRETLLLEKLQPFKLENKLIAQPYDGAAVMSGAPSGLQARLKETFPHAHFVHCYAHQLNLIMMQACSSHTPV